MDETYPLPTNYEKESLAKKYLDRFILKSYVKPAAIILAGIPGAGKTEYALDLVEQYALENENILLIDLDTIRTLFPGYTGQNAHMYQRAASVVLERILDKAIHFRYSFILDGTLQKIDVARKNLRRLLDPHSVYAGGIEIHYVVRDAATAWEFTQKRELVERRKIHRETFDDACAMVMRNVRTLKDEFGGAIEVHLVVNPPNGQAPYTEQNISSTHPLLARQVEL